MFTHTYETRYGDYKDFDTIKTGAVLDFVQDISIKDSERSGFGIHALNEMNLAWLMQGINVEFKKPVKTLLPIEVSTAVKTLKGVTSERGCIIRQNGEIVAKTVANWFLFNMEKMRISKVLPEMQSAYEFYEFDDEFFIYKKLKTMEIDDYSYSIKVSNQDIDTNMHLNNQKGADLLMDALPFDYNFNYMNVLYKKQTYLGTKLYVCQEKIDTGYYVHLMTEEKEICLAGTFENI